MDRTPPETNSALISRQWKYIHDTLTPRKRTKARKGPVTIYPPSFSTQAENKIFFLHAYGITINHTIRRMEYGGVFAEQTTHKKKNKKTWKHVRVGSDAIGEFIRDVIEIRNRYWSQKMFTSLVESKLLKATPLVYRSEEGSGVWRPERCFEFGGQELEELGWCFPPLASPPSVDGDAAVVEAGEFYEESAWTGIEDLSNYGEPLFGTETSDAGQNDDTVKLLSERRSSENGVAKLTFENLRALNRANTAANEGSEIEVAIPQLDGVMELALPGTPEYFKDMVFSKKIYSPNSGVQGTKIQNIYASATILSPLNDMGTRRNPTAGIIHKLLSKFCLRSGKRSPLHQLSKSQYRGEGREPELETNDSTDVDNQMALSTTNLDPFNEDDPKTKYLTTPFQTERYHILSKRVQYPDPYTPPLNIPHHPPLVNTPPRTPWRAPSVSYWCRPVNFDSAMQFDARNENKEIDDRQDSTSGRFLRSISGLNNITSPYLSVQYADTTRAYDAWEFRNRTETALVDLHVAMATGVYNRWLGYLYTSGDVEGNNGDGDFDDINTDEVEQGQQRIQEQSLRHYGVCLGIAGFSCWVAEPDLSRGHSDNDTTQSGTVKPSRRQWRGCTITKVVEGQVDKHMGVGALVEFVNRAHEYGMGSFIHRIAADLDLGGHGGAVGGEAADVHWEGSDSESDDGEEEELVVNGEFASFTSPYMEMEGIQVEEVDEAGSDESGGFCQGGDEDADESGESDMHSVGLGCEPEDGDGPDSTVAGDETPGAVETGSTGQEILWLDGQNGDWEAGEVGSPSWDGWDFPTACGRGDGEDEPRKENQERW